MDVLKKFFEYLLFLFVLFPGLGLGVIMVIMAIFTLSLITVIIFIIVSPIIENKIINKPPGIKKTVNTIMQIIRILLSIHSYFLLLCVISILIYSFSILVLDIMVFIIPLIIIQFIIFIIFRNKLNKIYINIFLLLEPYILIIVIRLWWSITHIGMENI